MDPQCRAGGHRPATIVIAPARTPEALREALFDGRTVAWFNDTLVGHQRNVEPVVRACIKIEPKGYEPRSSVLNVALINACPLAFTLRNRGARTIHNVGDLIRVERYAETRLQARMNYERETLAFDFEVLNGHVRPRQPMRITLSVALPPEMRPEALAPPPAVNQNRPAAPINPGTRGHHE